MEPEGDSYVNTKKGRKDVIVSKIGCERDSSLDLQSFAEITHPVIPKGRSDTVTAILPDVRFDSQSGTITTTLPE